MALVRKIRERLLTPEEAEKLELARAADDAFRLYHNRDAAARWRNYLVDASDGYNGPLEAHPGWTEHYGSVNGVWWNLFHNPDACLPNCLENYVLLAEIVKTQAEFRS